MLSGKQRMPINESLPRLCRAMNQYAWVAAESEDDAIDAISTMKLFKGPLTAAVDDKKMDLPRGLVLTVSVQRLPCSAGGAR